MQQIISRILYFILLPKIYVDYYIYNYIMSQYIEIAKFFLPVTLDGIIKNQCKNTSSREQRLHASNKKYFQICVKQFLGQNFTQLQYLNLNCTSDYQFRYVRDSPIENIQLFIVFHIGLKDWKIGAKAYLLKNGKIISSKYHQQRILFCRSFNKINSKIKPGGVNINPSNGHISFFVSSLFNKQKIMSQSQLIQQLKQLQTYLIQKVTTYALMILDTMDQLLLNYYQLKQNVRFQQIESVKQILKCLWEIGNICTQKFDSYSSDINQSKSDKRNLQKLKQFLAFNDEKLDEKKPKIINVSLLKKHLIQPNVHSYNLSEKVQNFQKIVIVNINTTKPTIIAENSRFRIELERIQFHYQHLYSDNLRNSIPPLNRVVIKKTLIDPSLKSIQKQIETLQKLQNSVNAYIGKYYYSKQNEFNGILFGDYYGTKTLNQYIKGNSKTISLFTIFFFLSTIIQGLRYLYSFGIVHLDLKPKNIIVGVKLTTKIIDFSSAHVIGTPNPTEISHTIPYASPQLYLGKINAKSDIYNLSIIIYQALFSHYPIQNRSQLCFDKKQQVINPGSDHLSNDMNNRYLTLPEKMKTKGSISILNIFQRLVLRGMQNPEQRPELQWILVCCKQAIVYLDKLY